MNKYELQLGDWVSYKGHLVQIESLNFRYLSVTGFDPVKYDEIEPIILSSEILESNGFKKDGYTNLSPDYCYEWKDIGIGVNLSRTCAKRELIYAHKDRDYLSLEGNSFTHRHPYVHELQHVMKMCHIEEEIVV